MLAPQKSLMYKYVSEKASQVSLVVKTLPADEGDVKDTGSIAGWEKYS